MKHALHVAALMGLALASIPGACAAPAASKPGTPAPAASPASPGEPATAPTTLDSLATSDLRERAIAMLSEFAASPAPELRANSMEALIPVPSRLEPFARRALMDENLGVRTVAALAVAKSGVRGLTEQLRPLLNDPSPSVRAAATLALQRAGVASDPSILAGMLKSEDPGVRAQAAFVLGEMGNASALPMLRSAARDPMTRADATRVRLLYLQLAEAMVKLGDENAIHEIRAALYPARPEDLEATALATQILGEVRDRGSASQLYYLATKSDPKSGPMPVEIRLAAAASLARMGVADAAQLARPFVTDPGAALRAQAALVMGESGVKSYLPDLANLMTDREPQVRIAAAAAILKITDGRRN